VLYPVVQLVGDEVAKFTSLTFPAFRPLLSRAGPESEIVAVGSYWHDIPIALALGKTLPEENSEVLSICVAAPYRGLGIGTALLVRLEQLLSARVCSSCQLVYMTNGTSTAALERLLQKCGWPLSQLRLYVFRFDRTIMQARWMQACTLPPVFEVFHWGDLRPAERLAICRSQDEHQWIPDYLVPFQYERDMETCNSLGLRCKGDVVGWVITHRIASDTVRYTNLFVRKELQKAGRAISLLAESIRRQTRDLGLDSFGICSVRASNTAMLRFLWRHAPSVDLRETRGTSKSLITQEADR
jgi:ribosomal protein S18 acetylase RimI-like enzyme